MENGKWASADFQEGVQQRPVLGIASNFPPLLEPRILTDL